MSTRTQVFLTSTRKGANDIIDPSVMEHHIFFGAGNKKAILVHRISDEQLNLNRTTQLDS
jgi:hypothetical protein